jgi:hypothetical protein
VPHCRFDEFEKALGDRLTRRKVVAPAHEFPAGGLYGMIMEERHCGCERDSEA